MKVYKFKNLIAFCSFFGQLGGCSDVHVSLADDKGKRWTIPSRLLVPGDRQLTRLFPYTSSDIPLMIEFVWVMEPNTVLCRDKRTGEEMPGAFRFPSYDDLARHNIKLNTTPKDAWEREAERRKMDVYVAENPVNFDDLLAKYLRHEDIVEAEI